MNPSEYFVKPQSTAQKQYCALAAHFKDGLPAEKVASMYGYTTSAFYSLVRDFKKRLENQDSDPFFRTSAPGRRVRGDMPKIEALVVSLRRMNLSAAQIAQAMHAGGHRISHAHVWRILKKNGFGRMARRSRKAIREAHRLVQEGTVLPEQEAKLTQDP